jgi:predicted RNase H-like HicB family nuclease
MNTINLTAVYEPCEEGGYIAYIDEIQGINSQGETLEEAKENLADAINLLFEEIRSKHSKVHSAKMKKLIKQKLTLNL